MFYHEGVQTFKPDAILRAVCVVEGKSQRYAFAVQVEDNKGRILLEGARYLGASQQEQAEWHATHLALVWGLELRFEKVFLELGFASALAEEAAGRMKRAQYEKLATLWQQFRLRQIKTSQRWQADHPLLLLAQRVHPILRKRIKSQ